MSKPATLPRIASTALGNILRVVQPPLAQRETGFDATILPAQWLNWVLGWLTEWAVYLDGLGSEAIQWLVAQRFDGASGDGNDVIFGEPAVTTRRCILRFRTFTGVYWCIFSVNGGAAAGSAVELGINANWVSGSSLWQHYVNTAPAYLLRLRAETSYGVELRVRAAGAGTWADGAWSRTAMIDALTNGLAVDGTFQTTGGAVLGAASEVAGDLTLSDGGGLDAEGDVAAGGAVTAGAGVTANEGDIDAQAAGAAHRASRLRLDRGTAFAGGDFTLSAGWGSTASVLDVRASQGAVPGGSANDSRGVIVIRCQGTGITSPQTITATWKDGSRSPAPMVDWRNLTGGGSPQDMGDQSSTTNLACAWNGAAALTAGDYVFSWTAIG